MGAGVSVGLQLPEHLPEGVAGDAAVQHRHEQAELRQLLPPRRRECPTTYLTPPPPDPGSYLASIRESGSLWHAPWGGGVNVLPANLFIATLDSRGGGKTVANPEKDLDKRETLPLSGINNLPNRETVYPGLPKRFTVLYCTLFGIL